MSDGSLSALAVAGEARKKGYKFVVCDAPKPIGLVKKAGTPPLRFESRDEALDYLRALPPVPPVRY